MAVSWPSWCWCRSPRSQSRLDGVREAEPFSGSGRLSRALIGRLPRSSRCRCYWGLRRRAPPFGHTWAGGSGPTRRRSSSSTPLARWQRRRASGRRPGSTRPRQPRSGFVTTRSRTSRRASPRSPRSSCPICFRPPISTRSIRLSRARSGSRSHRRRSWSTASPEHRSGRSPSSATRGSSVRPRNTGSRSCSATEKAVRSKPPRSGRHSRSHPGTRPRGRVSRRERPSHPFLCSSCRVGSSSDRIYDGNGQIERAYRPDPTAASTVASLAAAAHGQVFVTANLSKAGSALRHALGSGSSHLEGMRTKTFNLAPFIAFAALIPLGLVVFRRDLTHL